MNFNLAKYVNLNSTGFMMFGMQGHAMSYILFWTLTYALVHIYQT